MPLVGYLVQKRLPVTTWGGYLVAHGTTATILPVLTHYTRVRVRVKVRVRVRFEFCSFGFSFTEHIHAGLGLGIGIRLQKTKREVETQATLSSTAPSIAPQCRHLISH